MQNTLFFSRRGAFGESVLARLLTSTTEKEVVVLRKNSDKLLRAVAVLKLVWVMVYPHHPHIVELPTQATGIAINKEVT